MPLGFRGRGRRVQSFRAEIGGRTEIGGRSSFQSFGRFFWEMLTRGAFLPCSQSEAALVSAAHTEDDIDRTIEAAHEALRAIRS